jgi:hypothetical protein
MDLPNLKFYKTTEAQIDRGGWWNLRQSGIFNLGFEWPNSLWFNLAMAVIIGLLYSLLVLGPVPLNPKNIGWLRNDPAMYYSGWALFRQDSQFHWPLTCTDRIGYPLGYCIALMDVNPLLAVCLKFLSPLLPDTFQYLGLETILACVLQFFFALRLFRLLLGPHPLAVLLPSVFFLVSPPMTLRMGAHYTLTNHWLLTAALFVFCLGQRVPANSVRRFMAATLVLAGISVSINPYLAIQVLFLLTAAVITLWLRGCLTLPATGAFLVALGAACAVVAYAVGFVIPGGQGYGAGGFRSYSMNLLSPFDPDGHGALLSRQLPLFVSDQYEGYCYLGAGVMSLAIIAGVIAFLRRSKIPRLQWRSVMPFLLCCFILTLIALSTRITIGSKLLLDLDPNQTLTPYFAPLRSSGRLFWLPYYAILAAIISAPYFLLKRRWANVLVAVALAVQLADTTPLRQQVHEAVNQPPATRLRSPVWSKLGLTYKDLVVMPPFQCRPDESPGGEEGVEVLGMLAAAQKMRTNSYRAGRLTGAEVRFHCDESVSTFSHKPLSPTSVYVVTPQIAVVIASGSGKCHNLDGFILCSAKDDFGLGPAHWETSTRFWIRSRFKTIFMRDATEQELTKWTKALEEHEKSSSDFFVDLLTSPEFEHHSLPRFGAFLSRQGRWPTRSEWMTPDLLQPNSDKGINGGNAAHDRTLATVYMLYFAVLERDPDPVGLSSWTEAINNRVPLKNVVLGFLSSQEYGSNGYRLN